MDKLANPLVIGAIALTTSFASAEPGQSLQSVPTDFSQARQVSPSKKINLVPAGYEYYAESVDEIRFLLHAAENGDSVALDELRIRYAAVARQAAPTLVKSQNIFVSSAAVRIVADYLVFESHHLQETQDVEHARAALRWILAIRLPEDESYKKAASVLASLSDETALYLLFEQGKKGKLTHSEAANYISLADPESGSPFMSWFRDDAMSRARTVAQSYQDALERAKNPNWLSAEVEVVPAEVDLRAYLDHW